MWIQPYHLSIRSMIARSLSSISIILSKSPRGCFTISKFPMHLDIPNNSCINLFLVKGNSDLKMVYMRAPVPIWAKLGSVQDRESGRLHRKSIGRQHIASASCAVMHTERWVNAEMMHPGQDNIALGQQRIWGVHHVENEGSN